MLKHLKYYLQPDCSNINIEALNERFKNVCIFDSNSQYNSETPSQFDKLIAVGCVEEFIINDSIDLFEHLQQFYDKRKGWLFGYITYDIKNNIEQLCSENADKLSFPELHFFCPKVVLQINENIVSVFYDADFLSEKETEAIFNLCFSPPNKKSENNFYEINIQSKITKQEYIDAVNQLKQHIRKGDIYEVNFCQEFFVEDLEMDTVSIYEKLNEISRAPFSAYCKFDKQYLLSASPERFLKKSGNKLISQPIKGTIKRAENKLEDDALKQKLKNDAKERSENVMIVDLVRNDLSRIASRGSVSVDQLFGIYSFKQVHQMISTVSCKLQPITSFTDIIKSTFPMGSMTGAPKVSAMKLIEQFESTKRGLYSGAVGYVTPDGDFDFSVVIRSILHNAENKYTSFMVGSAITDKANAEQEFEECLLKAKAMFEVLNN